MSEKKSMVIKVKYPTSGKTSEKIGSLSNTITEWNYQRIGFVLAGLIATVMLVKFFSSGDDASNSNSATQSISSAQINTESTSQSSSVVATNTAQLNVEPAKINENNNTAATITRDLLTTKIDRNEPVGQVELPLRIGKSEKLGLYYFAELKGMKGKVVFHEWLLNDNLVSRKKVNISADPWRTSSKQVIAYTMNNDWKVRLVDEAGNNLSEKAFNLELK